MEEQYVGQMPTQEDVFAVQSNEQRIQNVLQQIAPDNQLMDLQWRIKGYVKNVYNNEWIKVEKDAPEPHPVLVSRYISYLSSILNQNTTFANYSSMEINQMMGLLISWISDDLDSNAEVYGLEDDYTERTRIGMLMLNTSFAAFKRAQNGTESRRIFKTLNLRESLSGERERSGGLKEALQFWK